MWLSRLVVVLLVLANLTGCGYRSLYGERTHGFVKEDLAKIRIEPIEDRIGQMLRNELLDLLTPLGQPAKPDFSLAVALQVGEEYLGSLENSTTTRGNLRVTATVALKDLRPGPDRTSRGQVFTSRKLVVAGYNIYSSELATVEARKNAEERAIREAAIGIQAQLGVFFAQGGKSGARRSDRGGAR